MRAGDEARTDWLGAEADGFVADPKAGPTLRTSPIFRSSKTSLTFSSSGSLALSPDSPPTSLSFSKRPVRIARRIV